MIHDYLNKRFSTRNLSDQEFEDIVEQLAEELVSVDYRETYTEDQLRKDWAALKKFNSSGATSASTTRVGMKLCEHFFPNFYNIKNAKGVSFASSWNKENLVKVLRWNRRSHSTPYISELKRGIYFCTGLTKNTMFRPHLAKSIVSSYSGNVVLDPCCGWGGRMLGTLASGKQYIGFDPNVETYNNLRALAEFLGEKPTIYNIGAEHISSHVTEKTDIILTSPPYFNLEIYADTPEQSENMYNSYNDWRDKWLKDVILQAMSTLNDGGVSCWNVHNIGKMKLIDDVVQIHKDAGFNIDKVFSVSSSRRQANPGGSSSKSSDITNCFKK